VRVKTEHETYNIRQKINTYMTLEVNGGNNLRGAGPARSQYRTALSKRPGKGAKTQKVI